LLSLGFLWQFLSQYFCAVRKTLLIPAFFIVLSSVGKSSDAQCSICTKTAQQMGEKPAKGLNSGILYLAFAPFAIAAYVGYRWWKNNS
jgi:hypothetical protein